MPLDVPGDRWWRHAVVYQIYPRSFCDTTGNGVGDLAGIRRHLGHIADLGVDAIWISPVFTSPMVDHGYDVADYCDIDPLFGDLAEFDRLLADAHELGLRVLLDWVPSHTSDRHPWFLESRSSRDNPKRDWYIWVDGEPTTPPNAWTAQFPEGPAWTWDATTGAWYLRHFTPEQPDLDWSNPQVRAAMHGTLRFWLDRGVDGFRMDVIHLIGKDRARVGTDADDAINDELTHEYLREIRALLDSYADDRVAVGEVFMFDIDRAATFHGDDDELHLLFNFEMVWAPWDAATFRRTIGRAQSAIEPRGAWPTWALGNHDIPRLRTRYGSEAAARAAAVVLFTLRGTPFIYAGDELGLSDPDVPPDRVEDPAGFRDGCRAPIPWDDTASHGWVRDDNWLPWPPEAADLAASRQMDDPSSTAGLYKRLLDLRRATPALQRGEQDLIDTADPVVGWRRIADGEVVTTLVNFGDEPTSVEGYDHLDVLASSAGDGSESGRPFAGALRACEAVVLRG